MEDVILQLSPNTGDSYSVCVIAWMNLYLLPKLRGKQSVLFWHRSVPTSEDDSGKSEGFFVVSWFFKYVNVAHREYFL